MTKKIDKTQRVEEIRGMVAEFADRHLDEELAEFALRLVDKLGRMRKLDITRGRPGIWAGTVGYVIARLNFLFDRHNPLYLTGDEISEFFDASKSAIQNKAGVVEKACGLHQGNREFSRAEIADALTVVELPGGIVVPMSILKEQLAGEGKTAEVVKGGGIRVRDIDEGELEKQRLKIARRAEAEQQRRREQEEKEREREEVERQREERRRLRAEEKRRAELERQPDLFGWDGEEAT